MAKVFNALGLNSRYFYFSLGFGLPVHCAELMIAKCVQMGSSTAVTSSKYNLYNLLKTNYYLKLVISIPSNKRK